MSIQLLMVLNVNNIVEQLHKSAASFLSGNICLSHFKKDTYKNTSMISVGWRYDSFLTYFWFLISHERMAQGLLWALCSVFI